MLISDEKKKRSCEPIYYFWIAMYCILVLKNFGVTLPLRVNFLHVWKNYPASTSFMARWLSIDGKQFCFLN
jgi:hypothetical protein